MAGAAYGFRSQIRISAKDALDAEYFWADPLPCDPKSLPKYESSHEFQTKKKRQQRQNEEMAKRQKVQQYTCLPPVQQSGEAQAHSQHWAGGHNHPISNTGQAPLVTGGPSHQQYSKPHGPTNHNPSVGGYYTDWSAGQGSSAGYGVGPPNYSLSAQYGGNSGAAGRGPNMAGNRNQSYSWQQQ
ncbi:hypothetical protein L1987_42687 [Smallanthus sonchifolius]|uniref:Uncharacterized protein n=1 Tax=Smallanthus sonchifolius TaxID=185202 RepID=A0ACB9GKM3_9ASTR|nr:hypothetical protein L1987_42687 [Smallanthus sonchifolius]